MPTRTRKEEIVAELEGLDEELDFAQQDEDEDEVNRIQTDINDLEQELVELNNESE